MIDVQRQNECVVVTPHQGWGAAPLPALLKWCEGQSKDGDVRPTKDGLVDISKVQNWTVSSGLILLMTLRQKFPGIHQWRIQGGTEERDFFVKLMSWLPEVAEDPTNPGGIDGQGSWFATSGYFALKLWNITQAWVAFLGEVLVRFVWMLCRPRRWRLNAFMYHVRHASMGVTPIVAIICFLIGMVLTFQSANELRRFGAEIFAIDLVSIATLREVGVLMAAVLVAGRSGSSFTAQIGFMKLNQEIDVLKVMGLNPIDVLVLPRIIALTLTFPIVVLVGNLFALLGCAVAALTVMDIEGANFLGQLQQAITSWTLSVGLLKAPFFAFVIALISCFEGLQVQGGAESVGLRTTRAVVESIFFVVATDAIFSVILTYLKL